MRRAVVAMAAVMVACGGDGEAVVSTVPTTVDATTTGETTTEAAQAEAAEAEATTVTVAETTTIPPNSVARSTVPFAPSEGWAIPAYVVMCESGGDYGAENPRSSASGAYQIVDGTWDGYGGYERAVHAPPAVQDAKAAELWQGGRGRLHWQECL